MKRMILMAVLTGIIFSAAVAPSAADNGGHRYAVTITNITRGQIISPPIVFSHKYRFELFQLGAPASDALAQLAEDGMTAPLAAELQASPLVYDVATAAGGIPPGQSITVEVQAKGRFAFISAAGMLVSSNDAFFAVRGLKVPQWIISETETAEAYDAGSEANTESCDTIPGPPCGSPGVRDTNGAEGYVHVHAGIHGSGDLAPEDFDWRNPVAQIEVHRIQ